MKKNYSINNETGRLTSFTNFSVFCSSLNWSFGRNRNRYRTLVIFTSLLCNCDEWVWRRRQNLIQIFCFFRQLRSSKVHHPKVGHHRQVAQGAHLLQHVSSLSQFWDFLISNIFHIFFYMGAYLTLTVLLLTALMYRISNFLKPDFSQIMLSKKRIELVSRQFNSTFSLLKL